MPVPAEEASKTASRAEVALATIEGELGVVFGSPDRVAAACDEVRSDVGRWSDPAFATRLIALLPLVHQRGGGAAAPVAALLLEAGLALRSWDLVGGLLESRDADTCTRVLDGLVHVATAGAFPIDVRAAEAMATLAERPESPLCRPDLLARIGELLRCLSIAGAKPGEAVDVLYRTGPSAAVRRLAGRVLDLAGTPPTGDTLRRVLGPAADGLAPLLAYTRASHLDLADLVPAPGQPPDVLDQLTGLARTCGDPLTAEIVGELGWRRANLGLSVHSWSGISVDDSVPLLVDADEADLVLSCPHTRRVFDRVVAFGHGGARGEGEAAMGADDAIARFRAYNLDHAEVLGQILDIAPLTGGKVAAILGRMDRITSEFVRLFASHSTECAALPALFEQLRSRIVTEMAAARPGDPLSIELTRLVQMFEDPASLDEVQTLHGLKRYLHQRGLALGFTLLESRHGTNRTLDFVVASREHVLGTYRSIEYVDFDPAAGGVGPAPVPYPVAIVADAFARQVLHGYTTLPRVRVFCYGNEVHYFVYFRNHPLFIRLDLSPPLGGGMIDLAYYGVSKYELDAHPAIALEAVQSFFKGLDFDVKVENTRITARYDKERARDLADLCARAEALFRLVPHLMDLDWTIGSLALPADARRAVGAAWATFFEQWGTPPARYVLTEDRTGILLAREPRPEGASEVRWEGGGPYADIVTGRPQAPFFAELRELLRARGLEVPLVQPGGPAGQMALDAHLLRPFRAARARGELVRGPDGWWGKAPPGLFQRQHEADRFAAILAASAADVVRSARLAGLASALERTLRFQTTGSVNGFDVQRAELVLRDERVTLYGLRDASGVFRLALFARGDAICLRRVDAFGPWVDNASVDVGELTPLLRRNNFLPSWIDVEPTGPAHGAEAVREAFRVPNPAARRAGLAGQRAIAAERAAPGVASGPARLGTRSRHPDDLDGAVLFSASLRPEDSVFLYRAAAVVATGGGTLSHAGLLAVQFGRPALIAPGTWREDPDGSVSLVCRRREFGERRRATHGMAVVERYDVRECDERIREGDLVVVDADEGTLTILGQSHHALALHDGLRQLVAATQRLARAAAAQDVLAERGRRLHAVHQLERLAGRLDDAALIQHVVRELLVGAPAGEGTRGETSRLLGILRARRETRRLVDECIARVGGDLARRHAAARDAALRLIPSSRSAYEVLVLRLRVVRARETLTQVREVLGAAGPDVVVPTAPAADDVDDLLAGRLEALLEEWLGGCGAPARLDGRHALREAERIAGVTHAVPDVAARIRQAGCEADVRDARVVEALAQRMVLWPGDGGLDIEPLAGAKAANLAELHRLGAGDLVPGWFVVTDHAFRAALSAIVPRRGGSTLPAAGDRGVALGDAIDEVLARTDLTADEQSAAIRALWTDVPLPERVSREVTQAYARLAACAPTPGALRDAGVPGTDASLDVGDPFVAVRSSAREEDTEASAGAGQFDTFLFVRGVDDVLDHLARAWSGLWTPRAIHARLARGGGCSQGGGVIVQRMAWSRVSGVLQTVNAAEERTREMVVNVGLGLGQGIVAGLVAADHIVVSKDHDPECEALRFHYVTADKRERVVFDARRGGGTIRAGVLSHQRLRAALEYVELVELVRAATRLEAAYRYPLDVEFGFEGAQLRLLQVRPVPGALAVWRESIERYPMGAGRRRGREEGHGDTGLRGTP